MIEQWLQPVIAWTGLGLIPLLLVIIIIIKIIKD